MVGLVIGQAGLGWMDPVGSLVIAALIFWQTWGLLRESVEMSLAAVPRGLDYDSVGEALGAPPGVAATPDPPIWAMSTTQTVLTAQHVLPAGHPGPSLPAHAQANLPEDLRIPPRHSPTPAHPPPTPPPPPP